ncbi:DUF4230 domain-containing protein [Streptomyces sp. NPDC097619]|uniref:DUF4230 domain-containing protein n=1 Tax=Streptomyces sp. NPDC097619 TaxID=3157228 RepID=UPI00331D83BA
METSTRHQRPERVRPSGRRLTRRLLTAVALLVVLAAALVLAGRFSLLPGLGGLFGEDTRDRSGPAVLKSIQDMHRYEGAVGNFQVVVDLEKDARLLPDAIRGTRTLYVGAGTVGAYVDFGRMRERDITVNEDRTEAVLRLPHAALGSPALDPSRSYAVSKQRGLLDRLGDFFSDNPAGEQAVQKLAVRHIADAARDSGLTARAEENTTAMLEGLLRSLGYRQVTVDYG